MQKKIPIITALALVLAMTALSALLREHGRLPCDYDGTPIQPIYEVELGFADGSTNRFCSLACAGLYLKRTPKRLQEVTVVDEVSGQKIDARLAFFVESEVFTIPHVKNNVHVFARQEEAQRHARQYRGRLMANPFAEFLKNREKSPPAGRGRQTSRRDPGSGRIEVLSWAVVRLKGGRQACRHILRRGYD